MVTSKKKPSKSASRPKQSISRSLVLATAAHDLRNPLSAIFGYAEVLLMEPGDHTLSDRQRELVHRIRGASLRGLELSKNLQSVSEHGAKHSTRNVLSSLLGGIHAAIESVWFPADKKLGFSFSSSLEATERVKLEQYELERLFGNLLSNAVKYSPSGAQIELSAIRSGRFAVVTVSNTGTFIPAGERAKIFRLFARGSHASTAPGSGLGLAIVETLVHKAKGTIRVTSSKPTGLQPSTVFTVRLPIVMSK